MNQATTCKIAAVGDIMLSRNVGKHFHECPQDFSLHSIKTVFDHNDLVFGNLEAPVSERGTPHGIQDPNVTFCCHPAALDVIQKLGITTVSLGNNHMLDFGPQALTDTIRHLDDYGIHHAGAGRNYREANQSLLLDKNSQRFAFLSHVFIYSASTCKAGRRKAGVADHRIGKILKKITSFRRQGIVVVVSLHWGQEYSFFPIPYQRRQAQAMIRAGATLILGHGPHYPQGIERYGDGVIVHSLGNFIFDEPFRYSNRGYIFEAQISSEPRVTEYRIVPYRIDNHIPALTNGRDEARMRRLIDHLSKSYPRRSKKFWQMISNKYFSDIIGRVTRMKSLKFLFLPPIRFYLDVGLRNYLKKLHI